MKWPLVLLLGLVGLASPSAQRDREPAPGPAVGAITGQVVTTGATPEPIRRAIVGVSGNGVERATVTTDDGRFVFGDLPAGRYTVRARKEAWIASAYGATRPGGAGTPVTVAAGAHRDVTIPLLRGAVIEGRISLLNGAPASRTSVRVATTDGGPTPRGANAATTDDRGIYRIYGVPPGSYVVRASPPVVPAMMQALLRPGTADIDAELARLSERARPGLPLRAVPATSPRQIVYAAVFYPGVAARDRATAVTVDAGETRLGLDFVFEPAAMSRVAGQLSGPLASFAGAQVQLRAIGSRTAANATLSTDGTFVFPAVAPGAYNIIARLDPDRRPPAPNEPRVTRLGITAAAEPVGEGTLWAAGDTEVLGQDIEGMNLVLQPGSTMTGRLRFADPSEAAALSGIHLRLVPVGQPSIAVVGSGGFTTMRDVDVPADGRFAIPGIAPGAYRVSVVLPPDLTAAGWWARSATAERADLLDADVTFSPGSDVNDVDVALSRSHASLHGRLQLADGRPGADYFVIAFSTDPVAWQVLSRRTHATRPADDGTFQLDDVPPGDYYLAVLTDFDPAALSSPDFFAQAAAAAVPFTLGEGEQKEQSFEIGR